MNVAYLPVTAIATYPFILGDVSGDSTTLPFHSPSAGLMSEMVMYANYKNRVSSETKYSHAAVEEHLSACLAQP